MIEAGESYIVELWGGYDDPRMAQLRIMLRNAMMEMGLIPDWKEYHPTGNSAEKFPEYFRKYGSGEIAMASNGIIILALKASDAGESFAAAEMVGKIRETAAGFRRMNGRRARKSYMSFFLALGIAFFPKCPFCWAAYMTVFSAMGLGTVSFQPWMLPVMLLMLGLNTLSMYFSRKRHGWGPLVLSLSGALLVILGKLIFHAVAPVYVGVLMLLFASLWNSLPTRMVTSIRYLLGLRIS